jgi:apolipoprotein N-acyltransferase
MTWLQNNWFIPWVVAGLLLGIGFVLPDLWILGILGISYLIHLTLNEQSFKRLCTGSVTAWTIKSAMALVWFWNVYPIERLAIDVGSLQLLLIALWWCTAAVWLGCGGIVFCFTVKFLQRYLRVSLLFLLLPFLWIVGELIGSLFFSIVTIGAGGTITTAFSFGYVGYLAAQHELLIQFARIAGVYSLGFLVVLLAAGVVWVATYRVEYKIYLYAFIAALVLTSFAPNNHPMQVSSELYTIAIIDTNFPLSESRSIDGRVAIQKKLESAMQAALALETDYIVLPEDARYFNQQTEVAIEKAKFTFRTENIEVVIVDSGRADDDQKAVLQSFVYNGKNQTVDRSHKRYLVPQGEFMPTLYAGALKLFGSAEVVDQITKTLAFEVGSAVSQANFATSSPGVLFCFESVSPWGVRKIMQERQTVPFIAHPVSHAWFNQPQTLWGQLDSMLRVQAIWNQQYIVSAGNFVRGYTVTPTGVIEYPEMVVTNSDWSVGVSTIPK